MTRTAALPLPLRPLRSFLGRAPARSDRRRSRRRPWSVEPLEGRALLSAGDLDTSFGQGGLVTTDFGPFSDASAFSLVVQPDRKLVAAGTNPLFSGVPSDFALARYNADGSLDTSFGQGGTLTTNIGGAARSLVLQPDGKLVAAGGHDNDFALVRFDANGNRDGSFGQTGLVTTNFGPGDTADEAYSLVVQPDGKLVAAGSGGGLIYRTPRSIALARYNADGSLDQSFGQGGKVTTNFAPGLLDAYAYSLVVQPDGKLVVAGGNNLDFLLARYNADGSLDSSFGQGGQVTTNFGPGNPHSTAKSLVLQPDGKLIALGDSFESPTRRINFLLARYNADGSLDQSFGQNGLVMTHFGPGNSSEISTSLVLQPNGKFVAAGYIPATGSASDFLLARYNADGSLDQSFGTGGLVTTNFGPGASYDDAYALTLQPDGMLVAAGRSYSSATHIGAFALARYEGDSVAPEVVQYLVNQGQLQRSNIESLSVRLNRTTNLPALIADGTITQAVQVVGSAGTLSLAASRYHYDAATFTLAVDLTIDGFGGSLQTMLADGTYQLRLDPTLITAPNNPNDHLLDNDGTADGVVRYDFHRLLGDFDGDGSVTMSGDRPLFLAHFGTRAGQAGYDPVYDIVDDGASRGVINLADYLLFTRRVGRHV